jgi:hypothetical protein
MARRQGGQNQNRGQGGGGSPKLELFVSGDRNAVEVSVRFFRGNTPQIGQVVRLFVGTETLPDKALVIGANGQPLTVTIGDLGVGREKLDLSDFPVAEYTQLTALADGRFTSKPLPTDIKLPGKTPAGKKRLRISPESDVIESFKQEYLLQAITFAEDGKTSEQMVVRFSSDKSVSIYDAADGSVIATNVTFHRLDTGTEGIRDIKIVPHGPDKLERKVRFLHPTTTESVEKTLRFR